MDEPNAGKRALFDQVIACSLRKPCAATIYTNEQGLRTDAGTGDARLLAPTAEFIDIGEIIT